MWHLDPEWDFEARELAWQGASTGRALSDCDRPSLDRLGRASRVPAPPCGEVRGRYGFPEASRGVSEGSRPEWVLDDGPGPRMREEIGARELGRDLPVRLCHVALGLYLMPALVVLLAVGTGLLTVIRVSRLMQGVAAGARLGRTR